MTTTALGDLEQKKRQEGMSTKPLQQQPPPTSSSSDAAGPDAAALEAAFLDPNFNSKAWINNLFAKPLAATKVQQQQQQQQQYNPPSTTKGTDIPPSSSLGNLAAATAADSDVVENFASNDDERIAKTNNELSNGPSSSSSLSTSSSVVTATVSPTLDALTSNLIISLQIFSQSIASKMEKVSDDVVKNVPRIMYDIDQFRRDAVAMKEEINTMRTEFDTLEAKSGGALENLSQLDLMKSRMEATVASLKEAENWSTLASDMESIFEAKDYEKAAARLQEAQRSLVLLQHSADYEERKQLLFKLQNELEASLSPQLVAALNDRNVELCKKYYDIFIQMNRGTDFGNYYYRSRKAPLLKRWADFEGIYKSQLFVEWLSRYYDDVFNVLTNELNWSAHFFPESKDVVQNLVHQVFTGHKPSFAERLIMMEREQKENFIVDLVNAFQISISFAQQVESILFGLSPGGAEDRNGGPTINNETFNALIHNGKSNAEPGSWGFVVFEAFVRLQQNYAAYESKYLDAHISAAMDSISTQTNDALEITKLLSETNIKLLRLPDEAISRCLSFTLGFSLPSLVDALDGYFVNLTDAYKLMLANLRSLTRIDDPHALPSALMSASQDDDGMGMVIESSDGQAEWATFQTALRVLALCVSMDKKLKGLEDTIRDVANVTKTKMELTEHEFLMGKSVSSDRLNIGSADNALSFVNNLRPDDSLASLTLLKLSALNSLTLRTFLSTSSSPNVSYLKQAYTSLKELSSMAQQFVFDSMFFTIDRLLTALPSLEVWSSSSSSASTSGAFQLSIPQFSLSPLPYITRIGEHLLTLPQQLELYVDDEALSYSIDTIPFADMLKVNGDEEGEKNVKDDEGVANEGEQEEEEEGEVDEVTHKWITSVAQGTIQSFLANIFKIKQLSAHGCKQLSTDIGYISNVFAALEMEPSVQLNAVVTWTELGKEEFGSKLSELVMKTRGGNVGDTLESKKALEEELFVAKKVAMMRNMSVAPSSNASSAVNSPTTVTSLPK